MEARKQEIIDKLRRELLTWEGFKPPQPGERGQFGLGTLETALSMSLSAAARKTPPPAAGSLPALFKNCSAAAVPAFGSVIPGAFIRLH
jgi:hypothetical protein